MKATRTKLLGLAIGEKSLFVAEVQAGEPPAVRAAAELPYPQGFSFADAKPDSAQAAELGAELGKLLRQKGIVAKNAIIGLPAKWLLVKPKEVPAADESTQAGMLRLEAETEFSTELKDLVFDFAPQSAEAGGTSVLLVATQKRHLDALEAMCEAARIKAVTVTATAIALARATGSAAGKNGSIGLSAAAAGRNLLVLTLGNTASELTAQQGASPDSIRHLRACSPPAPFVSELRRAVSGLGHGSGNREMVLWGDAEVNPADLGDQLGFPVRVGELKSLGVDPSAACTNGDGCRFAPAVALAMSGLDEAPPAVDFLHSRLAPPQPRRIPRWAYVVAAVVLVMLGGWVMETIDLGNLQTTLSNLQRQEMKDADVSKATDFVSKVAMAQDWYMNEARYEACMRDLLLAVPDDGETYATSLDLREPSRAIGSPEANQSGAAVHELAGTLTGRTLDKDHVIQLENNINALPQFRNLSNGPINANDRGGGVSFSITFNYELPERLAKK